jgi:hypothetical protein
MFRALLAHLEEVLHKRHLVYWIGVELVSPIWCGQLTQHALNIQNALCAATPKDEQVMLETCRGP